MNGKSWRWLLFSPEERDLLMTAWNDAGEGTDHVSDPVFWGLQRLWHEDRGESREAADRALEGQTVAIGKSAQTVEYTSANIRS